MEKENELLPANKLIIGVRLYSLSTCGEGERVASGK
jgi:hypothetical protein